MQFLAWGDSAELRKQLVEHLKLLGEGRPVRSTGVLLAVRFRRTAVETDTEHPRDYTYSVDVALPVKDPRLVEDMIDSRDPAASVRYDIVYAKLRLPGGVRAAIRAPNAPMMLDLVEPATGNSLFGQNPDEVAMKLGVVDVVQSLADFDVAGTRADVVQALTSGVNRRRGVWVPRSRNLFRTVEFPMAVMRALDSPASPCNVVARLHRIKAFPSIDKTLGISYESVNEAPPYPDAAAMASLTVDIDDPSSYVVVRFRKDPANGTYVTRRALNPPDEPKLSATLSFPVSVVKTTGSAWSSDEKIEFSDKNAKLAVVLPHTVQENERSQNIATKLCDLLAKLRRLELPQVGTSNIEWHHLFVVRMWKVLGERFPPEVLDDLITVIVGTWAHSLFSGGFRESDSNSSFWFDFSYHLVSESFMRPPKGERRRYRVLRDLTTSRYQDDPRVDVTLTPFSMFGLATSRNPEYAKLARAVGEHMLPLFAQYSEWRDTEDMPT